MTTKKPAELKPCQHCDGIGQVEYRDEVGGGSAGSDDCRACGGTGRNAPTDPLPDAVEETFAQLWRPGVEDAERTVRAHIATLEARLAEYTEAPPYKSIRAKLLGNYTAKMKADNKQLRDALTAICMLWEPSEISEKELGMHTIVLAKAALAQTEKKQPACKTCGGDGFNETGKDGAA